MNTANAAARITVAQYERFKGYPGLRDELIWGEIVMSPQPKPLHQVVTENVHSWLKRHLKGTEFRPLQNSNLKFTELNSMPAPDVFVTRREEIRTAIETDTYLTRPPVLVIEVLSPANRRRRIQQKIEVYRSAGVTAVWIIDPKQNTLRSCTQDLDLLLQEGDSLILPDPLSGSFEIAQAFLLDEE